MCYFLISLAVEAWAPFYASAALILLSMFKKETRLTWHSIVDMMTDLTKSLAQLAAILSAAGLLIGGLTVTGVALSFSRELVVAVGNNSFLILLAGAFTSFVLGLGMPTTACYIFLAVVMVPALVALKINPMGAHLFVFYWGALSDITPPTALCVAAASGIAGSNFMQTGWTAMKLGFIKYVVPFFFVYNPALLTHGSVWEVLYITSFAIVGIFYLGSALEGYLWGFGKLNVPSRILILIGGALTAFPEIISSIVGLLLLGLITLANYLSVKLKKEK